MFWVFDFDDFLISLYSNPFQNHHPFQPTETTTKCELCVKKSALKYYFWLYKIWIIEMVLFFGRFFCSLAHSRKISEGKIGKNIFVKLCYSYFQITKFEVLTRIIHKVRWGGTFFTMYQKWSMFRLLILKVSWPKIFFDHIFEKFMKKFPYHTIFVSKLNFDQKISGVALFFNIWPRPLYFCLDLKSSPSYIYIYMI